MEEAVHELSVKFYKLLRLYKAKKTSLKARMNSETFKARKGCQQSFWRFASKLFNEEDSSIFLALTNSQQNLTSLRYMTAVPDHTLDQPGYDNPPPLPFISMRDPISQREIEEINVRSRSSSTPSPLDHVSYILKHCPSLSALLDLYNSCLKTGSVPQA